MIYRLLWAAILILIFVPQAGHAEAIQFMCATESSAEAIAGAFVSTGATDGVAAPYIARGECYYLPAEVHVDVTYYGGLFIGGHFQIGVVGFIYDGWMQYGLMPVDEPPTTPIAPKRDL